MRSARFDPDASDGDGDGLVQDLTNYERPGKPKVPAAAARRRVVNASAAARSPKPKRKNPRQSRLENFSLEPTIAKALERIIERAEKSKAKPVKENEDPGLSVASVVGVGVDGKVWSEDFDMRINSPGHLLLGMNQTLKDRGIKNGTAFIDLTDPRIRSKGATEFDSFKAVLKAWRPSRIGDSTEVRSLLLNTSSGLVKFSEGPGLRGRDGQLDPLLNAQARVLFSDPILNWRAIVDMTGPNSDVISIKAEDPSTKRFISIFDEDLADVPGWLLADPEMKSRLLRDDYDSLEDVLNGDEEEGYGGEYARRIDAAAALAVRIDAGEDPWEVLHDQDLNLLALRMAKSIKFKGMVMGEGGISLSHWVHQNDELIGILKSPDDKSDVGFEYLRETVGSWIKEKLGLPTYSVVALGPTEMSGEGPWGATGNPRRKIFVEHLNRSGFEVQNQWGITFDESSPPGGEVPKDLIKAFVYDFVVGQMDRHQRNALFVNEGQTERFALIDEGRAFSLLYDTPDLDMIEYWPTNFGWAISNAKISHQEVEETYQAALDAAADALDELYARYDGSPEESQAWQHIKNTLDHNMAALQGLNSGSFVDLLEQDGRWNGEMS